MTSQEELPPGPRCVHGYGPGDHHFEAGWCPPVRSPEETLQEAEARLGAMGRHLDAAEAAIAEAREAQRQARGGDRAARRSEEAPVPDEQQLAADLWKCHFLALEGMGDDSVSWWTLQPVERQWWIDTARHLTEVYDLRRRRL